MEVMEFKKYIFLPGLNITVRKGTKWDIFQEPKFGILKSVDPDDPDQEQSGLFLASIPLHFVAIPNALLRLEHDPDCRTWFDLLREMERIYPDFDKDDEVTIVFFRPEEP